MREMKDCGVSWLGMIPKGWNVHRIKTLFSERIELSDTGNETLLSVSEYYGVDSRSSHINEDEYLSRSESLIGYKKCYPGDIVSNIMLAWKGSLGVARQPGIVSPAYCVYKPVRDMFPIYYHYLFRTSLYRWQFKCYSKGIIDSRLRLYSPFFFDIPALIPPVSVQQSIGSFLDARCADIDSIIEKTRASLDEYKKMKYTVISEAVTKGIRKERPMKDSNVEWIGCIPEEWAILPIKQLFLRRLQKNQPIVSTDRLSLSIDVGITKYEEKTTNLDRFKDDFSQYQLAYPDDIVLNSMNMIVGAVGRSAYFGCVSPVYYVIYPRQTVDVQYWSYLLNCTRIRDVYHSLGQGIYAIERGEGRVNTCRLKVPYDDFERILVPIPSLEEQKEIASYLDDKCKAIDSLIASKDSLICELESYKNSIIYEYVTGKKEIPVQEGGMA